MESNENESWQKRIDQEAEERKNIEKAKKLLVDYFDEKEAAFIKKRNAPGYNDAEGIYQELVKPKGTGAPHNGAFRHRLEAQLKKLGINIDELGYGVIDLKYDENPRYSKNGSYVEGKGRFMIKNERTGEILLDREYASGLGHYEAGNNDEEVRKNNEIFKRHMESQKDKEGRSSWNESRFLIHKKIVDRDNAIKQQKEAEFLAERKKAQEEIDERAAWEARERLKDGASLGAGSEKGGMVSSESSFVDVQKPTLVKRIKSFFSRGK